MPQRHSVLDAGIPIVFATLSLVTILGTVIFKRFRKNHTGDQSGYLPISTQEDNLNGSETDIDDQEILDQDDAPLNPTESNMHLGQVPSGRHITLRDALKTLAALISLGISITWLIVRSNEDKNTYLYLAPLVSTIAWVRVFCIISK